MDRKFTETHEWVDIVADIATIGITTYAICEIGEVVYVDLPQIGQEIDKDSVACVLESTKAAIDITCPISGTVVEINQEIKNNPSAYSGLEVFTYQVLDEIK